jgi:hypothetical protein
LSSSARASGDHRICGLAIGGRIEAVVELGHALGLHLRGEARREAVVEGGAQAQGIGLRLAGESVVIDALVAISQVQCPWLGGLG